MMGTMYIPFKDEMRKNIFYSPRIEERDFERKLVNNRSAFETKNMIGQYNCGRLPTYQ